MGAQPTPVVIPASQTTGLPSPDKMPRHVAIVMDGNGRWAKSRGLPRLAGHRAGTETCAVSSRLAMILASNISRSTLFRPKIGTAHLQK
jgi:undecaprenyl diphosphate synthase